uniref:Nucleoprotein TPR n=1 Tax=Talaromyces marneffei PM1 TaxID=1077442 RepID=A0A093V3K5_TALMA
MATASIEIPFLASHYGITEDTLTTISQAPTVALVNQLLESITVKARESDELKSDKLRLEVELENAVRASESKIKVLKNSVEKGLNETATLRTRLQESENGRSTLESEITALKSSTTSNESEVNGLKSRISSLESSNRDTLALLESKTTAYDKLSEELTTTHQKTVELRRQLSTAEQNLQSANSSSTSSRFREQSLQQELELTKKNNEYFEAELKAKSAEYLKFRKEKNARVAELQREMEEASSTIDQLRRSENALKSRLDDIEHKYEESIAAMQSLREDATSTSEALRIELESANRLAELQGNAAATAKQRVQECQIALEKARDDAAEEIARLRAEIETEHSDKETAERKVAELEAKLNQAETQAPFSPGPMNGGPSTPIRASTPIGTFSPRTSRGRGGLTLTQLYTEYDRVRSQLVAEQRNNAELKATLDEMVQDLESSKPEIDELRADHARLENAVVEMSEVLETSGKERDEATREARKWRGQVEGLARETEILRQQLRDLSAQVKVLVLEVTLAKEDQEYDRDDLEKLARNEIEESMASLNATGRFITQNLTTFKDLGELQEQNVTLRRMLRELGDRMESQEARERESAYLQDQEELKELRIRVQTYRDEIMNLTAQTKSYVKERDTFRSMLMRRGQGGGESSIFSQSVPLGSAPPTIPQQTADGTDYADLLRKVQAHFDTFRQETATDHSALKQQVNDLSRKNSELMNEASRLNSQLGAAAQRAELLQNNFNLLKNENVEIQKRYSNLLENVNRQDIKTQQAAEDLVAAKGMCDSLQRENANLKAEKDLWKNIEKRLIDDNESLRNERGRLDSLNTNLQNILNEREHTDAESRRRLQHNVESLESELQSTKRKLNDEVEDAKRAALRREYEHEQSQKRIDDLVTSLSSVREELIAVKTTRDHLQTKVDELSVELKSAEEKLQVLQTKPGAAPGSTTATAETEQAPTSGLTREQELAIEVSELKRDLELARTDLEHAREQVEDYKAISQATEERLQSVTDTQEQYCEETEQLVEEKDRMIQELEKRVEEISSELTTTNNELSKLRDEQSEVSRRVEDQKTTYEAEISRLRDEAERQLENARTYEQSVQAQAEIAQQAQQNYESELVKHAEAAKLLQTVRSEANQLRLDIVDVKTQAENAKKDLAQKKESWSEQKDRFEREVSDLQKRREEVLHQNTLLHNQLENITKQITALQRDRANIVAEEEESEGTSSSLESLQEVIKYLRREKEIVDVQYHLSTQESKRLRQQLDYTQSQLDDTRLKLEQQRRATLDSDHQSLSHNKLVETLNELNVFRESSVTLRNQARQAEAALAEKSARVDELVQQIEPLQNKIRELENLVETKDEEMKLIHADRDRWQQRTENILQKYDRVDPTEMENLKEKLLTLENERDEAIAARDTLQQQVDGFPEQLAKTAEDSKAELRSKLTEQFVKRSKELSGRINAKQSELNAVQQEKEVIQQELTKAQEALNQLKSKPVEQQTTPMEVEAATVTPAVPQLAPSATPGGDEEKIKALEEKVARLEAALAEKEAQFDAKLKERSDKMKEAYNNKVAELRKNHQQELENVKAQQQATTETGQPTELTMPRTPAKGDSGELPELTDSQAKDLVAKNETIKDIIKRNIQNQVNKVKVQLQQEARAHAAVAGPSPEAAAELETKLAEERERLKKASDEAIEEKVKSAIELNDKKIAVKISMLESRAKTATAKLQVVQKAATETPEKPVREVWEVAKDAKAPPATPATPAKPAPAPTQTPVSTPAAVTNNVAPAAAATPAPVPAPAAAPAAAQPPAQQQQAENPFAAIKNQQAPQTQPQNVSSPFAVIKDGQNQPAQPNQQASIPPKLPAGAVGNHPGSGPAALRALQSGLPIARGRGGGRGGGTAHQTTEQQHQQGQPSQRGTGIQRGRGRGRGGQHVQSNGPQNAGQIQESPGGNRGALNAGARQFIPQGNKRPREDGGETTSGDAGGAGKRIRGGGQNRGS